MKKIIPIILVVAILAGLGYFFMANKFAMTTLISQDKAKIASTYDRAVKGLNNKSAYEYTIKTQTYTGGKTSTVSTKKIKIIFAKDDTVKKIYATVTTKTNELEVFYEVKEGVATTYVTSTPKGSETSERTKYINYTADDVLDTVVGAKPVLMQVGDNLTKTTLESLQTYQKTTKTDHKKTKSSIVFSFKPFYIGAKLKNTTTISDVKNIFEATVSVTGKLKNTSLRVGSDTEYTRTSTVFNDFNKGVKIYWKGYNLFTDPAVDA